MSQLYTYQLKQLSVQDLLIPFVFPLDTRGGSIHPNYLNGMGHFYIVLEIGLAMSLHLKFN